ncbi:MAG TPA: EamA family transporter [Actinomycetes bacterium]|nr:EamA family transporter [Actinomycetes bacterium]
MVSSANVSRTTAPLALWTALGIVYIVWGSTYLGIRVVVEVAQQPPLFPTGLRFVIAGCVLATAVAIHRGWRALRVPLREAASGVVHGFLFLFCGVGMVSVAEQTVPSGLAALLVAAMPLWVVLMRTGLGKERPARLTWIGTIVGLGGIAVLARPNTQGDVELWGVLLILFATVCWAFGVFITPRLALPNDNFVGAVYEMVGGGCVLLIAGAVTGEFADFSVADVPAEGWWAFAYLTVIGSVVAFSAFVWLLGHAPPSLVTTYAYINPVVAVFLGWLILSEPVTRPVVIGGSLAVLGVALVVRAERPRPSSEPEEVAQHG